MLNVEKTTDAELIGQRQRPFYPEVRGGWLCDEVGMGKTAVCISLILAHPEPTNFGSTAHLTVVAGPPTLLGQWADEVQKFAPSLRVATYHQMSEVERVRVQSSPGQYDVVLTSFYMDLGKILNRKQGGCKGAIRRLIIDEAHLATQSSKTRDMVAAYRPHFVWMLTGTPVSSTTRDLEFGMVSLLGSPPLALPFMSSSGKTFEPAPSASLATALRRIMIRHTKSMRIGGAAALALPEKDVSVVWLDMNQAERALYHKGCLHEEKRVQDLRALPEGAPGYRLDLAVAFRRQACSNAYKVGNCYDESDRARMYATHKSYMPNLDRCTKLAALIADLEALRRTDRGMHAVVFTHYLEVQAAVVASLQSRSFVVYQVSGSTDMGERATMIRNFQAGGAATAPDDGTAATAKVFVFTVKLGSVGLTLTAATRVYLLEPAFDPAAEAQMAGRIHRLGQSKEVLIKKFAFRNSIDENIVVLHERIRSGQIAISNGIIPPRGIRLLGKR